MRLLKNYSIVLLKDLSPDIQDKIKSAKCSYTIPWDVQFKEESVSTPARPVFDGSSRTPGGYSLNDLLAKGDPNVVRLLDMVVRWRIGKSALVGDIKQFYNNVLLHEDHWAFQKVLLKKDLDPDSKTLIAIIITLIYGIRPVGAQCEAVIRMLAEEIWESHPKVAMLLILARYVDDFGLSTKNAEETRQLREATDAVLAKIHMEVG